MLSDTVETPRVGAGVTGADDGWLIEAITSEKNKLLVPETHSLSGKYGPELPVGEVGETGGVSSMPLRDDGGGRVSVRVDPGSSSSSR